MVDFLCNRLFSWLLNSKLLVILLWFPSVYQFMSYHYNDHATSEHLIGLLINVDYEWQDLVTFLSMIKTTNQAYNMNINAL